MTPGMFTFSRVHVHSVRPEPHRGQTARMNTLADVHANGSSWGHKQGQTNQYAWISHTHERMRTHAKRGEGKVGRVPADATRVLTSTFLLSACIHTFCMWILFFKTARVSPHGGTHALAWLGVSGKPLGAHRCTGKLNTHTHTHRGHIGLGEFFFFFFSFLAPSQRC